MTSIIFNKKFMKIFEILLIIFSLYIIYQIIKRVAGGSWQLETVVITLVMTNLGMTLKLLSESGEIKSDHKNFKNQFYSLATDFKKVREDVSELKHNYKELSASINSLRKEMRNGFKSKQKPF